MRRDNSLTMGLCLTGPCIQISLAVISSLGERILSVYPSTHSPTLCIFTDPSPHASTIFLLVSYYVGGTVEDKNNESLSSKHY